MTLREAALRAQVRVHRAQLHTPTSPSARCVTLDDGQLLYAQAGSLWRERDGVITAVAPGTADSAWRSAQSAAGHIVGVRVDARSAPAAAHRISVVAGATVPAHVVGVARDVPLAVTLNVDTGQVARISLDSGEVADIARVPVRHDPQRTGAVVVNDNATRALLSSSTLKGEVLLEVNLRSGEVHEVHGPVAAGWLVGAFCDDTITIVQQRLDAPALSVLRCTATGSQLLATVPGIHPWCTPTHTPHGLALLLALGTDPFTHTGTSTLCMCHDGVCVPLHAAHGTRVRWFDDGSAVVDGDRSALMVRLAA